MGSRGCYKIQASAEEGKAAQLDQSYRSCLMALIIFFFMCIILILVCLFALNSEKHDKSITTMSQTFSDSLSGRKGKKFPIEAGDEPPRNLDEDAGDTIETDHPSFAENYTTTEEQPNDTVVVSSTQVYSLGNSEQAMSTRGSTTLDSSSTLTPTSPETAASDSLAEKRKTYYISEADNEPHRDLDEDSDEIGEWGGSPLVSNEASSTAKYTNITEQPINREYLFVNAAQPMSSETHGTISLATDYSGSIPPELPPNSTAQVETVIARNISERREIVKLQSNLTDTSPFHRSTDNYMSTETVALTNKDSVITDNDMSSISITETTLTGLVGQIAHGEINVRDIKNIENSTCILDTCQKKGCKQVASKILSYMDHWANACDDFYEYACGGLKAHYLINEKDSSRRAYETVKRQAEKQSNDSRFAEFNRYYDSCLDYQVTYGISERVKLAKEAVEEIGKFYTSTEWKMKHTTGGDLNEIFTKLLQNDWPLLFDIIPDVDKAKPEVFTLTIGPRQLVFDAKPFHFRHDPDRCENQGEITSEGYVDFDALYGMYDNCKKNTERTVNSINRTLSSLDIFDNLKDDGDRLESIDSTLDAIQVYIIERILKKYSSERIINEAYKSKMYSVMTLGELQGNQTWINWTRLIYSLTKLHLGNDARLYVYNKEELIEAMNELEELWKNRPCDLNNALLALYSQHIYTTFVIPKSLKDLHNHCLYKSVHAMKDVASLLYIESFTDIEIKYMNQVLENHFNELKETLRQNIKRTKWTTKPERNELLKKLNDIKMSLPKRSDVQEEEEEEEEGEASKKLGINDNYFENSMKMMKKYRRVMYSMIKKKPLNEIWRFFASPFDANAQTIYALNLIAMPYGAVEVDMKTSDLTKGNISYLSLATIGNVIARQIAQNFDMNAMSYWNGFTDKKTKDTYENEYIHYHQSLYEDSTFVKWRVNGQSLNVHFKVPTVSLNERLSDIVGLRLARDTLDRLNLKSTPPLPWLNLNVIQLFYLTFVQAHCTKAPLESMYISLKEDPLLPSRIRVYVASNNNGLFEKEWNCPPPELGPPSDEKTFPHLDYDE